MEWHVVIRDDSLNNVKISNYNGSGIFYIDLFNGTPWKIKDHGLLENLIKSNEIESNQYDLLVLAMAIFSIDHMIHRKYSYDNWQRHITVYLPVQNVELWENCIDILQSILNFLSGDKWYFKFRRSNISIQYQKKLYSPEHICLFSGGADSLVGAIDLLENDRNVEFVGHHGKGVTFKKQKDICEILKKKYRDKANFNFHFVEAPKLKNMETETTTRARSFLFIALAASRYNLNENSSYLYIPENGLISLNIPLTPSRTGSLSTKTTHPYYLKMYQKLFDVLDLNLKITSDYQFMTKGEMFKNCSNQDLLKSLLSKSMSCSHPEQSRWNKNSPDLHCGRCLPCLIRKSAIKTVQCKDAEYATNVLVKKPNQNNKGGSDYRAILMGVERFLMCTNEMDYFLVKNSGPLCDEKLKSFISVYQRGMNELSDFLLNRVREKIL